MNTPKKHAIFHLPQNTMAYVVKFAQRLEKEGFKIFGNDEFISRASISGYQGVEKSDDNSRRADILITVGDYSKNNQQFHCIGNAYSIDIDVSSLENELQAMWLVVIATRIRVRSIGETGSAEDATNYATVEPFLTALKVHKTAIAIRASEIERLDYRIKKTTVDVGEAYRSSISHSPFIDRLMQLAAENPKSIYADIVAKLDTVPG
jgi:hypothetical protein